MSERVHSDPRCTPTECWCSPAPSEDAGGREPWDWTKAWDAAHRSAGDAPGGDVLGVLDRAVIFVTRYLRELDSADARTLSELRELIAEPSRLVRCEACGGSGGGMVGEEPVGCEYCHATGRVIVLPSSLLERTE